MKRVAVIGVGYLGEHHARIYSELEEAHLFGVVDKDLERARSIAEKYHCRYFTDYRDVIEYVDAVSIVTPTVTHYEIARDFLINKKDVLLEKPMTVDLDSARELVELAEKNNVILQIGHLERYNPAYVTAKSLIIDPQFLIFERLSPFQRRGVDVDITFDLMIHDIDLIMDILKEQRLLTFKSSGASLITDKIDSHIVWLEFERTSSVIHTSRVSKEKRRTLTAYLSDRVVFADFQKQEVELLVRNRDGNPVVERIPVQRKEPLKEELRDFLRCAIMRGRPLVCGRTGMESLSLAISLVNELRQGERIIKQEGN